MTDKEILEKYPYCKEIDWMTGEQIDNGKSCIEDVPEGWRLLFLQMCDEINKCEFIPKAFGFCQIKEKYGELRVYTVHTTTEIENIINIYSLMSRHICIRCGRPNVARCEDGWIFPACKKCHDEFWKEENYDDVFDINNSKIDTVYKCSKFNSGNGLMTYEIDITDHVNRYINEWNSLFKRF